MKPKPRGNGYKVSFWGDEEKLELNIGRVAQYHESTKDH